MIVLVTGGAGFIGSHFIEFLLGGEDVARIVCLDNFNDYYDPSRKRANVEALRPDLALSIFTNAIYSGQSFPLFGDGSIRRDFTHVRDICRGLATALSAEHVAGQTTNLGHDSPVEMREIINRLEGALRKKAVIDRQPERPENLPATWADLDHTRRLLDYQPHVTLDEGIPEFVDWFVRCRLE